MHFTKSVAKKKAVNLASLPPTADAADQHFYRVYFQVQKWLSNDLDPQNWGWEMKDILIPVTMNKKPAPKLLLDLVFCNCKKGSCNNCTCKKAGLYCSNVCGSCCIRMCPNLPPLPLDDDDSDDENEEILPSESAYTDEENLTSDEENEEKDSDDE